MKIEMERRRMKIFFLIAFGLSYGMGIGLYYAKTRGVNISVFPAFQMFTPALGVMLALVGTRKEGIPKKFFFTYILLAFAFMILALSSFLYPKANDGLMMNILAVVGSIALWITYFLEKKENREKFGLHAPNKGKTVFILLLFFVLYVARTWIGSLLGGEDLWAYVDGTRLFYAVIFIPNFFLAFAPFFGEEYGWRYYLQPILQKKYGMVKGIFLLGILWGLWHLPLNLLYYSSGSTGIISLVNQLIICITMSIFMGFAYNYTGSIWTAVWIHYINNNYILLFVEHMDPSVIESQIFTWQAVLFNLIGSLVFLPFIWFKWVKDKAYRVDTLEERLEEKECVE